jgi:hypothetical protein
MKTQEEIEQLAEQYIKDNTGDHYVYCGFIEGYTQCQEDMDDKKYTKKQLLDAMSFAECYIIEHDKPLFLKSDGKPVPDCLEYIKSLNKQY